MNLLFLQEALIGLNTLLKEEVQVFDSEIDVNNPEDVIVT